MSKRNDYEKRTEELITPILDREGFELVDVEYVKEGSEYFLRAYIEKPGRITIDHCLLVSREMNHILDRENYISDAYTFEVSSPGLTRPFKKDRDFERNIGKDVDLTTYAPVDGAKEFTGILKAFDADTITLSYGEDGEQTFDRKNVNIVHPAIDF